MNRVKLVLLIILLVVLVDFALENHAPTGELKLLQFTLGTAPTFLLVYGGLAVGLVVGWMGHVFRVRKKRRRAEQTLAKEAPAPAGQQAPGTAK